MEGFLNVVLANLPTILCLIVGIALLILEVFLPGFGVPGFSGIALMLASVALVWINHGAVAGLIVAVAALTLAGIAITASLRSASKGKLASSALVLPEVDMSGIDEKNELGELIGREGVADSVLRPAGIVEFDGVRLNVVSEGGYIEKGACVRVDKIEGNRIVVKKVNK
ncbi:MAG: hypothetical protein E7326_07050 [Clostridiales bacterium]|nr:hypothetical protein [Clostridiales bacterium]